jgi:hypothetical protein
MNLGLEIEPSRFQAFQLASRFSVIPNSEFRIPQSGTLWVFRMSRMLT